MVENSALKINPADNVVVAIRNIKEGEPIVVNGQTLFKAAQNVEIGHKIALGPIKIGDPVIRYGEAITRATCDIRQGEWIHLHNTQSALMDMAH